MPEIVTFFAVFITIFLSGMAVLRTGLKQFAPGKIQTVMAAAVRTPVHGLAAGALITALVQSSSAVMVMAIGLIAAGHLSFRQSIGIILGTNIGTTFTAEMLLINIEKMVVPLLIIGAILLLSSKAGLFNFGTVIFGLGCILTAMQGFERLAPSLSAIPAVQDILLHAGDVSLVGVGLGTLLTAVIQSSSAATGIVMGFMNSSSISLQAAIAIVLGTNVGTCITAYLASLGSSREAKLTAYAHIWVNVLSVLLFLPFIKTLNEILPAIAANPDSQIAHLSVVINVVTSAVVLPFAGPFGKLIEKVHGS
ncbi:Na/Pi symporter [Bacillus marinisedimentorum]|uniref:Na/Pi symporter n=1 Tax=Bacillus marinisedimentorum TaxID=1821260 RepID=UPI0009F501D9|nr:Na/Pi symporter [Bacillus marinisedimentorum]